MDNIDRLNELIEYVEKHLDQKISYKKLASILCVNEYSMHRIFNFLTGISIRDYIRYRRLSLSAIELLDTKIKIIDLAIKYRYDSPIAFSRAFKKFHGVNPSKVKENLPYLKNYPPFDFSKTFSDKLDIDFTIVNQDKITLYGYSKKCDIHQIKVIAPEFWKELPEKYPILDEDTSFGIIEYDEFFPKPKTAKYYIASSHPFGKSKKITIPKSTWAVFKIENMSGEAMASFSKYIYKNWVPYSGYNIRNLPEIEAYYNNYTEWWLPIEKNKKSSTF